MIRVKLVTILIILVVQASWLTGGQGQSLPLEQRFKGTHVFNRIAAKGERESWGKLPMGERVIRCALELNGIPYRGFTLEIDDRIEAPSVDFLGLDCWTFFETAMGLARMFKQKSSGYRPEDLLREIQFTRYRGGRCSGNYLERIHYLAEWYVENEARGTIRNLTKELGGVPFQGRICREMTLLWKSYRYLRENPSLRPGMAKQEQRVSALPVLYIPRERVGQIESKLQNGDVIGIATRNQGGFCSHVGLAIRTRDGSLRLMHASSDAKKVIIDASLTKYLNRYRKNMGILVGRPLPIKNTVTKSRIYQRNLSRLTRQAS